MVDLGEAESVDALIYQIKSALVQIRPRAYREVVALAARLYERVFLPIEKKLGGRKHIYLSPDGNLNLIPFEIFYEPDAGFLIENYTFNYVASGRDLIGRGASSERGGNVLLIGDPDFDLEIGKKAAPAQTPAKSDLKDASGAGRSFLRRDLRFDRLPGTRQEVQAIYALLGEERTALYTGEQATEDVLRRMKPPRILHLATHGFFLKDIEVGRSNDRAPARGLAVTAMEGKDVSAHKINIEAPLLRSGFVLAGANHSLTSAKSKNFDGVVTAEKILGLKLLGTEMVVLSACNTGIGEVKTGEGVFGLRRAFTQAGAQSLVMSMWSVPDTETRELMVAFYENILAGNMNRCQALRQAALAELEEVKKRYAFPHPLYWGAFVFMGEP
jgi:CHAT domain-containing protein